jgi:hypothetical protein
MQFEKTKNTKEAGDQTVPTEAQCAERKIKMHTQKYEPEEDKANGQFKEKKSRKGDYGKRSAK